MGCGSSAAAPTPQKTESVPLPVPVAVPVANNSVPARAPTWKTAFEEQVVPAVEAEGNDLAGLKKSIDAWMHAVSLDEGGAWVVPEDSIQALQVLGKIAAKLQADESCLETSPGAEVAAQINQLLAAVKQSIDLPTSHVKRVAGGSGWALHGLAFELQNGTRLGQFLDNSGGEMDLLGDAGLKDRGGKWQELEIGEYIVEASGYNCKSGYLAYGVDLKTNSGRTFTYSSSHTDWKGSHYSFKAAFAEQIEVVNFQKGCCTGIGCVPVVDWGAEFQSTIRSAFVQVAEPVITTLAIASTSQGAAARKYALFHAERLGYSHLDCLKALKHQLCNSMKLPIYWDRSVMTGVDLTTDAGIKFEPGESKNIWGKVELDAANLQILQYLFDSSFRQRYTRDRKGAKVPDGLKLVKGYRVQNAMNWIEFVAAGEKAKADLASLKERGETVVNSVKNLKTAGVLPADPKFDLDIEANCAWLFHGTNDAAADAITKGDFRIDQAGSNAGTLYGRGVYLAESCSKSDEYSQENSDGLRCMLLCRAVLGNINYCDEKSPDVNKLVRSCVSGPYHSVLGDREKVHNTFRELIVYDDDQAYPEYVVWYRRVYK